MNNKTLISAIIPSYNSARFVTHAVESALSQTYEPTEVIVIDDGSTDDTHDRLAPYHDRIRYIRQVNAGLSGARNRGMKEAHGEFFAFLDADDIWLPEKLTRQSACLRENPEAALVHTDTYMLHDATGEHVYVPRHAERFQGRCYTEFFWSQSVTPSTVLVSRECIEEIGPFDEAIRGASTQDLDLWIRISRRYSLAYVDEPLVLYRLHATNGSGNLRMMVQDECYVLTKAFRDDPSLWNMLGVAKARRRMFDLTFGAGYLCLESQDFLQARRYFRQALAYLPINWKGWAYWASTFLPPAARQALRSLKQRVVPPQLRPAYSMHASPKSGTDPCVSSTSPRTHSSAAPPPA